MPNSNSIAIIISLGIQMPHYPDEIEYSDKYCDDYYEYRHVILPRDVYKRLPRGRLLTENVKNSSIQEWRSVGVQQSRGWAHYEMHKPEPHILLFRRAKGTDPQTGLPPPGFVAPSDTYVYWTVIVLNSFAFLQLWPLLNIFSGWARDETSFFKQTLRILVS